MTEPAMPLFDPAQTTDQHCPIPWCQAIRYAGQQRTPTCAHDLDREKHRSRPKGCVNTIDPSTAPFPEGF